MLTAWVLACASRAGSTSRRIILTRGKTRPTSPKYWSVREINWSADQYSSFSHCTVVANIFVADQLNFFMLFYKTYQLPERHPCPFIGAYMIPIPRDEFPLVGGRFSLISFGRGMGPCYTTHSSVLLTPKDSENQILIQ